MTSKFSKWLENELLERHLSPAELSRLTRKDQGVISRILSGERMPNPDTLLAISRALDIPPEKVYRAAGILPTRPDLNETQEEIIYELQDLNDQDQQEILAFIRMKNNLRKKK